MKICHITSVHSYNDIRISIKECSSLVRANYEVHLIAPNTDETSLSGIHVHGINNPYNGRLKRVKNFTKDIYHIALKLNAEIYHFHDPELIPVGLKLRKKGKKVIYDIHEDVPRQILTKYWIPKYLRKLTSFVLEKYENHSVKKFTALVTATAHIKERFHKFNDYVVNINNYPILDELFDPGPKKDFTKEKSVIYIGGISKDRGSVNSVKAVTNTDAILKLAGKFNNDKEKKIIEELPGWNRVNFLGFLDRNQVKKELETSIAGLVVLEPRKNYIDSLPIKMFEYMAAGIPVIASNFPLWKVIIEGNHCGLVVDPLNISEISRAIQWVLENPDEATRMGENGRRAIETYYNWETESKKLISLYEHI